MTKEGTAAVTGRAALLKLVQSTVRGTLFLQHRVSRAQRAPFRKRRGQPAGPPLGRPLARAGRPQAPPIYQQDRRIICSVSIGSVYFPCKCTSVRRSRSLSGHDVTFAPSDLQSEQG